MIPDLTIAIVTRIQLRIASVIDGLANDPRPVGSRGLTGIVHTYRIRVGDDRLVYVVDDALKEIVIAHWVTEVTSTGGYD